MVALIGAEGTVGEQEWSQTFSLLPSSQVVADGALTQSVGGGTREAVTGNGWVYCSGALAKFTASSSATLTANGGTNDRKDFRVAEFNWNNAASALGTAANSVEVKTVQGAAGGAVPNLTQTPGVLWQVPLGLYTVPAGGGGITVLNTRPARRVPRVYKSVINTASVLASNTAGAQRAIINVPYPGWPYLLQVMGMVLLDPINTGNAIVTVNVDDADLTFGHAGAGNNSPAVIRSEWTDVKTDQWAGSTVKLIIAPSSDASAAMIARPLHSGLTVVVHPA